jgi:hypothetical protein
MNLELLQGNLYSDDENISYLEKKSKISIFVTKINLALNIYLYQSIGQTLYTVSIYVNILFDFEGRSDWLLDVTKYNLSS